MSTLRKDPTTGGWVIVAPERGHRPGASDERRTPSSDAAGCPLCPGHEGETPPELLRIPAADGTGWSLRVVPNKFAVLSAADGTAPERDETPLLHETEGIGHHELVVESPLHDRRMAELTATEVARVIDAYHARYLALRREPDVAYVVVFKNRGTRAGASLAHPHSQIVATPIAPLALENRLARARAYLAETDRCLYCDLVDQEIASGDRVVAETARFLVFCPFASGVPYETWIVPKTHQPSFGQTSVAERAELGALLRSTLATLDRALDRPDFNYVLHTAPAAEEDEPSFLWHVQILPRVTTFAGFELGTGIPINPCTPEDAAARLRSSSPEAEPC